MDTLAQLQAHLSAILCQVDDLYAIISAPSRPQRHRQDFIDGIQEIENQCRKLRAVMISHSRGLGSGIRANGEPDMRFNSNRTAIHKVTQKDAQKPDLRFSSFSE